jgi:hypothetical protein
VQRALLLLLALLPLPAAAKDDPAAKTLEKVARVWADYARWCKEKGQKEEALSAINRARDAGAKDLDGLALEVEALEGAAEDPGLPKRREQAAKEAAALYDKLAKSDDAYLLRAAETEPTKARLGKLAALVKELSGNRANAEKAGRILVKLRDLDPQGKWDAIEQEMAKGDVALVKGKHAMVGYLSVPKGWKKGASLPVLVAVEGAGCGFLGRARDQAGSRGRRARSRTRTSSIRRSTRGTRRRSSTRAAGTGSASTSKACCRCSTFSRSATARARRSRSRASPAAATSATR